MENQEYYEDMLPEGAIPMVGIRIISYYDEAGQMAYKMSNDENGTVPITSLVGLVELVKQNIIYKSIEIANRYRSDEDEIG